MKYKEQEQLLTKNACYISNGKFNDNKGVLIHCTATPGATPERFSSSWNVYHSGGKDVGIHTFQGNGTCSVCGGKLACVNAFCDDSKVIKTLPYNMRPWGCGSGNKGSGNNYYVQIEICEPVGIYYVNGWNYAIKTGYEDSVKNYIKNAFEVAAQWSAERLKEMGIKVVNTDTVTSHYEEHLKGYASNHGDPQGLFALAGLSMNQFRDRVNQILNEEGIDMTKAEFIESLTPAEAATLVNKARQYYRDLEAVSYAKEPLEWGKQHGIMVGNENGNQMPCDIMTRQDAISVLKRYDEYKETGK